MRGCIITCIMTTHTICNNKQIRKISNRVSSCEQKDWVKNLKTKVLEKQVMVQNGAKPETYIFMLEGE